MSIICENKMNDIEILEQFIIEEIGAGHFLSRDDYQYLQVWLDAVGSCDELLVILESIFERENVKAQKNRTRILNLSKISKFVESAIRGRVALVGKVINDR